MSLLKNIFCVTALLLSVAIKAQNIDSIFSTIDARLGINDTTDAPDIFLHPDKTVYRVTDDIWFTAYLLNSVNPGPHHTLHVLLINDMTGTMVSDQRYVLDDGLGSGNIPIPDSLESGEYSLIAYTNMFPENRGQRFFRQSFTLIGAYKPPFELKFLLPDQYSGGKDSFALICKLLSANGGVGAAADFNYSLYADGKLYQAKRQKTDAFGETPFILPISFHTKSLEIKGEIKRADKIMHFKAPVQWESNFASMQFFPEGGQLIAGVNTKISFQLKNTAGKAIATKAVLLEDNDTVTSFQSDIYGSGVFDFTPRAGKHYSVAPLEPTIGRLFQQFPEVISTGYSLRVNNSLVRDTLVIDLAGPAVGSKCIVAVHNDREVLGSFLVSLPNGKGRLRISASEWTRGTVFISLLNEKGILQQKRSVMILANDLLNITLKTDSSVYRPRSKVTLHVVLKDIDGNPVRGVFSFSCAMSKTINNRFADIKRFQFFDRFMHSSSPLPPLSYLREPRQMETSLVQQAIITNQNIYNNKELPFPARLYDGRVEFNERKLKRPVQLLIAGPNTAIFNTDSSGYFVFPYEALRGTAQSKVLVSVTSKNTISYSVTIDDAAKKMNDSLASRYYRFNSLVKDELSFQEKEQIRISQGQALQEVVVKARNTTSYFGRGPSKNCDDYVCPYNILNCSNHPRGTMGNKYAVEGESYRLSGSGITIIYHCDQVRPGHIKSVNATWYTEKFYDLEPSAKDPPPELLHRTTLHWDPLLATDEKGEATISFYTNEATGKFSGIIQGVSQLGIFSGSVEFSVK